MKNLILIIYLLFGSLSLFSQLSLGVESGIDYSWITTNHEQYKRTNVPIFGINACANIEIPLSEKLLFRSGIGYSVKGSEQPILVKEYSNYFLIYSRKIKLHYIHLPIKITYIINPNKTSLFTSLGILVDYGLKGNVKEEGTEFHHSSLFTFKEIPYIKNYNIQWNYNNSNQIGLRQFDFGGLLEIGLHSKFFEVSCQYEYGFSHLIIPNEYAGNINTLKFNVKTWFNSWKKKPKKSISQ